MNYYYGIKIKPHKLYANEDGRLVYGCSVDRQAQSPQIYTYNNEDECFYCKHGLNKCIEQIFENVSNLYDRECELEEKVERADELRKILFDES